MKYLSSLIIALLMLTATATAQNTVIYTQPIEGKVTEITINSGWKVTLVPRTDDSTLVSLVMPQSQTDSEHLDSIFGYNAKKKTLFLKRAPLHMEGQEVRIYSNFANKYLTLNNRATAYAQNLTIGECSMKLGEGARLVADTLRGKGECSIDIEHAADLIVNTLAGDDISLNGYGSCRIVIKNYTQKELIVDLHSGHGKDCYTFPDSTQVVRLRKDSFLCDADTLRKIYVNDRDKNIWIHNAYGGITLYNRWNNSNLPGSSPYKLSHGVQFGIRFDLYTQFQLAPKWWVNTGVRFDMSASPFFNQVAVDENGLLQIATPSSSPSRIVESCFYLGIPVQLCWALDKPTKNALCLDLFAGVNLRKNYVQKQFYADSNPNYVNEEPQKGNYRNPFKLEAGISFMSKYTPGFKGMRLFYNLLPEYRRDTGLPKVRTFGVEMTF